MTVIELPPKGFTPVGCYISDMENGEKEEREEIDICEDCHWPITCQRFEHCICKDNDFFL